MPRQCLRFFREFSIALITERSEREKGGISQSPLFPPQRPGNIPKPSPSEGNSFYAFECNHELHLPPLRPITHLQLFPSARGKIHSHSAVSKAWLFLQARPCRPQCTIPQSKACVLPRTAQVSSEPLSIREKMQGPQVVPSHAGHEKNHSVSPSRPLQDDVYGWSVLVHFSGRQGRSAHDGL